MDIYQLKKMSAEDRQTILEGEALSVEEQGYMKPLSEDEISIRKDELSEAAILKAIIEEELNEVKAQYKEKLKPLHEKITEAINAIKNKSIQTVGKVYKMADYENQMIHVVDPLGNVLSSRRMLPEERQYRIPGHTLNKAV